MISGWIQDDEDQRRRAEALIWLLDGGGGFEGGVDDLRAMSLSAEGLIDFLSAYQEYLEENGKVSAPVPKEPCPVHMMDIHGNCIRPAPAGEEPSEAVAQADDWLAKSIGYYNPKTVEWQRVRDSLAGQFELRVAAAVQQARLEALEEAAHLIYRRISDHHEWFQAVESASEAQELANKIRALERPAEP